MRNSPFDDNVSLLAESIITNGKFELNFDLPYDTEIIFSVNDLTTSKQIEKGFKWEVALKIIQLPKPDDFGNDKKLEIISVESTSEVESTIFEIEREVESIKDRNRKAKGKIGKKYISELEQYLIEQITKPNSDRFDVNLSASKTFVFSLSSIKRAKSEQTKPELYFLDNFQISFNGLEAINILYAQSIHLDFLTKELGKSNYFDFIKTVVSEIEDNRIRQSTLAVLITNALGRKWTNQEETKKELSEFIDQCEFPELKTWLETFKEYHSNSLIGIEIRDFKLENTSGDQVSFSDYRGKYLLVDFWATWCGPCIKNMKKLPELKSQHDQLEILCITDEQDTKKINRFIGNKGYQTSLDFGIAKEQKEMDSYFNKRAIPLYFLISPEGIIIDRAVTDPIPMIKKHLKN